MRNDPGSDPGNRSVFLFKLAVSILLLSPLLLISSPHTLATNLAAQQASSNQESPLPDWLLDSPVNSFFGHKFDYPVKMVMKAGPVRVSCFSVGNSGYYDVDRVRVENGSSKPVVKLKLNWTLTMEEPPNTVLEVWESELMRVDEIAPGGPKAELNRVKFRKVLESPVEDRNGSWMLVEVGVDEVEYKDGTKWKRK